MNPPDDPLKPTCLPCHRGRCAGCLWRTRPTSCGCSCAWLVADVLENFPSLRRAYLLQGGKE